MNYLRGTCQRADLHWTLERGDIRPVDGPTAIVRRARADAPVDHATDLLARRCDHLMVRNGLYKIADLDPQPPVPTTIPSEMGPWASDDWRVHTAAYATGMRVLRAAMADDAGTRGPDHADDDPVDTDWAHWPMDPGIAMFITPASPGLVPPSPCKRPCGAPNGASRMDGAQRPSRK
jgi:hypothetical protein